MATRPLRIIVNYGREFSHPAGGDDRPMGGIITAALGLCFALARRGHEVHLFLRCPKPGVHNGLTFHDRQEFAAFAETHPPDVLIGVPELLVLLMPVRTRARVVWTGNAFKAGDCALEKPWVWSDSIGPKGRVARLYSLKLLQPCVDHMVVGSRWHARQLVRDLGVPERSVTVAYLGVPLEHYGGAPPVRHPHRFVYASQARRGLGVLLQLFPQIRSEIPDAELHVFGLEHRHAGEAASVPGAVQPGVIWRGSLRKSGLAQEFRAAGIMAYPCAFKETFCIAVAEAQAAGLPVVTTGLAALAERVSDGVNGILIRGDPRSGEYQQQFLAAVMRLMHDPDLYARMSAEAAAGAQRAYDWNEIAQQWEAEVLEPVMDRELRPPNVDPTLDLLHPALLTVADRGASAEIPPQMAKEWLRETWASYGYNGRNVPGLPRE